MNRAKKWLLLFRGKERLFWGFCPCCNSDAPVEDNCQICLGGIREFGIPWPPDKEMKKLWWKRYKLSLGYHG